MSETNAEVKVEDISPIKKKLSFDIAWDTVKEELDTIYLNTGKQAKIKGFRNGKVPRKILESLYKDHVEGEAITNLINNFLWQAMQERAIIAVNRPDIEQNGIEKDKGFTFTAIVEVEPAIDPKDYDGLELVREEKEITDSDIDAKLQEIRHMFGTMEEIHDVRDAQNGDFAVIDFEGSLDGQSLKELKADNYMIEIGSGSFVPGFEDQIIGMKKDESKTIQVKIPEDYGIKRIAGKDVIFTVTLKSINEKKLPEIDENFIKNFEKYQTLEDLRSDIRKTLVDEYKAKSDSAMRDLIITKLLEKNEFEVPPSFVERQIYYMMSDAQNKMLARGMNKKDIEEMSIKYRDMYRDEATKIVKSVILMKNIAIKESITVDEQEIESRIIEIARLQGQNYDAIKKNLEENDMMENIKNEIASKKVFKYIEEHAQMNHI